MSILEINQEMNTALEKSRARAAVGGKVPEWLLKLSTHLLLKAGEGLQSFTQKTRKQYLKHLHFAAIPKKKKKMLTRAFFFFFFSCGGENENVTHIFTLPKKCWRATRASVERTMMVVHIAPTGRHPAKQQGGSRFSSADTAGSARKDD